MNVFRNLLSRLAGPERTGAQAPVSPLGLSLPGLGNAVTPPPAYATYRAMSAHPTLALARGLITAPVLAGAWTYVPADGADAAWAALAKAQLEPLRHGLVRDALRALEFGWYAFEKVYAPRGGQAVLTKLKPLLPELTEILVDANGALAGLRQGEIVLPPEKCFVHTHDGEAGNLHGRSRHENCRRRWAEWEAVAEKASAYQRKVASIVAQVHYPEGTGRDAAGAEVSNYQSALRIAEAVAAGRSVVIPNLFAGADDVARSAELAGKSQYVISFLEPGGTDFSAGFVAHLRYLDALLFRGWLRPERSGLEGGSGARAEAQVHTESAVADSELIAAEVARSVTANVVDDLLALNFGEAARGGVRVVPTPIVDQKLEAMQKLLSSLVSNPAAAADVAGRTDLDVLLDQLGIPRKSEESSTDEHG